MQARTITYSSPDFTKGYHAGFFACTTQQGNAVPEQAMQGMLTYVQEQTEHQTPSWRTGYITGWYAALFNMTNHSITRPLIEQKQPATLCQVQEGEQCH